MIPKQILIIGGGASIKSGIDLGLKDFVKDKFVITCNFACYHFDSTFTTFIDQEFYRGKIDKANPSAISEAHINKLKSLPLIIGNQFSCKATDYYPNTIYLHSSGTYDRDIRKSVYSPILVGLFTIHLAMYLMNYSGELFLCGFDWSRDKDTHYYNEINHRGIGFSKFYEKHPPIQYFKPFLQEKEVKIYNVIGEPKSNIDCFPEVTYPEMMTKLTISVDNQNSIRAEIKEKLCFIK